jgi:hypothetical protein
VKRSAQLFVCAAVTAVAITGCATEASTARPAAVSDRVISTVAQATPNAHSIHFFDALPHTKGGVGHVVITGGIGDYGTTRLVPHTGSRTLAGGQVTKVMLKRGTFMLRQGSIHGQEPTEASSTCSISQVETWKSHVSHGTGRYAGISGTLDTTVMFAEVSPKFTSGAKKGQCHFVTPPKGAVYETSTAHGKVTF